MDGQLEVATTLRNILHVLQTDARKYRCFGVYWWPVKALLKTAYGPEQLAMLGDYIDPLVPAVDQAEPAELLRLALEEFTMNDRYNLGRGECISPDGDPYTVYDEDAGI